MEERFPRDLSSLSRLFTFIDLSAQSLRLPQDVIPTLYLVAEELFTNMVKHQRNGTAEMGLSIERAGDLLTVRLVDPDSDQFDPTLAPEPDLTLPIHQRRPGGLGVFLAKKIMDEVRYEYQGRTSTITLTKTLRKSNA